MKRCRECPVYRLFDYDGQSVARRQQLEKENAILRRQNAILITALRKARADQVTDEHPTRH